MHAAKLASDGMCYLGELQLSDLCQLQDDLDTLWTNGQAKVSNNLYDKVVDGINYRLSQLTSDPYKFAVKQSNSDLKNIVDYFATQHARQKFPIDDAIWNVLQQEFVLRTNVTVDATITLPSQWTAADDKESCVQLITLARTSQEFQDLSNYFIESLGRPSTVVYSIIRIENIRLWKIHQQLKRTIQCQSTRLIHGTALPIQQKSIIYHGFYRSYCPNGLIGDGVYFPLRASYSNDDPYVMRRTAHRRELFICQVLLGKTTLGRNGLKAPPSGSHAVHFSNTNEIDEFCIFNHYQAYPEYIVQYDYE